MILPTLDAWIWNRNTDLSAQDHIKLVSKFPILYNSLLLSNICDLKTRKEFFEIALFDFFPLLEESDFRNETNEIFKVLLSYLSVRLLKNHFQTCNFFVLFFFKRLRYILVELFQHIHVYFLKHFGTLLDLQDAVVRFDRLFHSSLFLKIFEMVSKLNADSTSDALLLMKYLNLFLDFAFEQ